MMKFYSNWNIGNDSLVGMFENVKFFTDMSDQIYSNGTPFNYFMSQKYTTISVPIRSYSITSSGGSGNVLTLTGASLDNQDNDLIRIQNALSIPSMNDLDDFRFTSSVDPTSRDILSVQNTSDVTTGTVYYYNVSGSGENQNNFRSGGPYTISFTRRT